MAEIRKGKKQLGQHLLEKGLITQEQLKLALEEQRKTGLFLREVFLQLGFVSEEDIISFFEEELNIPSVQLSDYSVDRAIIDLVPEKLARRYRMIPLFRIRNTLTVAMEDPLNVIAIDEISSVTGLDVDPFVSRKEDITLALRQFYGTGGKLEIFDRETSPEDLGSAEIDNQVVQFVENVIRQAVEEKASDIHIEPDEDVMRVRIRVDGVLKEAVAQPLAIHPAVVTRIKVLSELDIAEKRLPQDGRFQLKLEGRMLDMRVSTFPTIHGENVVIRLLDKSSAILSLNSLGLSKRDLKIFRSLITKPNGMILVTGPTGSGKTTTLYAALQAINTLNRNIVTLEDPVEYILPLVRQTQINEDVGLTFARGLRSLLRQDPDAILVGEIRDAESAEIAIRAALTGHLVLSTVHTNDAVGAIARLLEMGIEPFLIASSLLGVLAQRLVRRVCEHCVERYELPEATLEALDVHLSREEKWHRGKGCMVCGKTGYRGRAAIFELIEMSKAIRTAILLNDTFERIEAIARESGMRTLREDGLEKAAEGVTTVEEVLRVTRADAQTAETKFDPYSVEIPTP